MLHESYISLVLSFAFSILHAAWKFRKPTVGFLENVSFSESKSETYNEMLIRQW